LEEGPEAFLNAWAAMAVGGPQQKASWNKCECGRMQKRLKHDALANFAVFTATP